MKKERKGMNSKSTNGITLIALVITIVVLVILAGVAINLSLSNNGIFNRAKQAREQYKMAEVKEKIELAIVDIQSEKMGKGEQCTIDTIISELPGKVDGLTISKDGENAKGKYNNCDFTINSSLKLTVEGYTPSTGGGTTPTITLNKTNLTLFIGSEETLTATISQTDATNKEVTWSTSADTIATVDTTGKITAVAEGTATITATAKDGSGKSASCTVTVKSYVEYVDYPIDLNGDGDTTNDWVIFYKADGNAEGEEAGGAYAENVGDYYIIAADYLKNTDSRLKLKINKSGEYAISWNGFFGLQVLGIESRIVTGRINTSTTINKLFMQNKFGTLNSNENSCAVSELINTDNWDGYVNASYADYAIGVPTLEMWVASWNARYGDTLKLYTNIESEKGYYVGTSSSATIPFQDITSVTNWQNNTLYFPHDEDYGNCSGYLLASPCAYARGSDSNRYFLIDVTCAGNLNVTTVKFSMAGNYFCVRPVVHLKSDIQLEKNPITGIWEKVN